MNHIISLNSFLQESNLKLHNEWTKGKDGLSCTFSFSLYADVIKFVNEIFKIAETQNHHPKLIVEYDKVIVSIFNHEKNKVSDKCYKFKNAVDKLS